MPDFLFLSGQVFRVRVNKLRMGAGNVGTTGAPGELVARGGDVAGDLAVGGVGITGLRTGDTGRGAGGAAGINAPTVDRLFLLEVPASNDLPI
jgi:hypothetical protein